MKKEAYNFKGVIGMERRNVSETDQQLIKERSKQWLEIDGVDVSEVPRNVLNKVMRTIRETRGVYGDSHDETLLEIYATIQDSKLSAADKAGLIVSSTKDIVGRENRTPRPMRLTIVFVTKYSPSSWCKLLCKSWQELVLLLRKRSN